MLRQMKDRNLTYDPALYEHEKRRGSGMSASVFLLKSPALLSLFVWSIIPLVMSLWFSFRRYNLLDPSQKGFAGLANYRYMLTDPSLGIAIWNTVVLLASVLLITIVFGTLLAVLFDQDFFGRGFARVLVISPFFVMPTVSALLWKNMLLHPASGIVSLLMRGVGLKPIDWFAVAPLASIIAILSWQWLPFATLTLLTALQSLDGERKEAARMDGAGPPAMFYYIIRPHLGRAIASVTMIETIFLLTVFAEIFVTTSGGPGFASTNLSYLIYRYALVEYDVGSASVGGIIAILLANVAALFLIRSVARNLDA